MGFSDLLPKISLTVQNPYRIAGILLIGSFLILLLALFIMIASGAFPAFSAGLQDSLEEQASFSATFRWINLLYAAGWIVQLLGFALLTSLLVQAGEIHFSMVGLVALSVAAIFGVLEGTFHANVTTWAAQEAASPAGIPEIYLPLRGWISTGKMLYTALSLFSLICFGWAIMKTKLAPAWLGKVAVGWGLVWLLAWITRSTFPAILFVIPPLIGIVLLQKHE
jgi:hypothetical protein